MRKILILLFIFSLISLSFALNDDKSYVENLIKTTTNKVLSILNEKGIGEAKKKEEIFKTVNPIFDFNIMARLALGRKNWNKLTKEQRKKFIELFTKRIRMVYLDRVTLKKVKVTFKKAIQKKKNIIFMPVIASTKEKDYSILFKFWKSPKGWKVYDVEVEGVSIIRTYRSQFNQILSKGTVKDLFKKLEEGSTTKK